MDADRLGSGELKAVLRLPLLNTVNTQLHSRLHSVYRLSAHTRSKVVHEQGAIRTIQDRFNDIVNPNAEKGWKQDATLRDPHLLLVQLRQNGTHSNLCLLYTSPSPRDRPRSRMPSSA